MYALSPKGTTIIGLLETLTARTEIERDSFSRKDNGELDFQIGDEGTTPLWHDMESVTRDGKHVFLDEEGEEWTADQITLSEVTNSNEVPARPQQISINEQHGSDKRQDGSATSILLDLLTQIVEHPNQALENWSDWQETAKQVLASIESVQAIHALVKELAKHPNKTLEHWSDCRCRAAKALGDWRRSAILFS